MDVGIEKAHDGKRAGTWMMFARRVNSIALFGALIGLMSFWWPFVVLRPNRAMPIGEAYYLFALNGGWGWLVVIGWLMLAFAATFARGRARAVEIALAGTVAAAGCIAALTWGTSGLVGDNEVARMSIASGAWVSVAAIYVTLFSLYNESPRLLSIPVAVLASLVYAAPHGHLGVMREYAGVIDAFHQEFVRHILLVSATMPLTMLIGVSLGWLAVRKSRFENMILGMTSFLQTVPSIALFGLLLPVLSSYGRHLTVGAAVLFAVALAMFASIGLFVLKRVNHPFAGAVYGLTMAVGIVLLLPVLGSISYQFMASGVDGLQAAQWSSPLASLGVRGLGVTPAIVALTMYGVWPLVVNTHIGLKSVPAAMVEAAKGMGMSARQVFLRVEMPIAAPFFIQGIRGALLLLIGLATVATLVNAGGLGYFLMRGTEQSVSDLVLLGSLPVVGLALTADGFTRLLAWGLVPKGLRS